jgi:RNA polymerase sigma-70 factor (family 1)
LRPLFVFSASLRCIARARITSDQMSGFSFPIFRRRSAFELMVEQHRHRVMGYASYYMKDQVLAEDVTQEVFVRLWDQRDKIDEARVSAWLIRVTRNVCIDMLRRQQLQRGLFSSEYDEMNDSDAGAPSPEEDAESNDFQVHLKRCLDRLPEPHRSIVILREIQEHKYEEIGEALDLPLNTVKVYLHRARKMLRKQLEEVLERETTA